ncbi:MAG: hypothetical protein V4857_03405 [Pseudomonadota bacterium]
MLANHPPLTPPRDIARRLPDPDLLQRTLRNNIIVLPAGSTLARAAWNPASVLPAQVNVTYRFGQPAQSRAADGSFPFHWIYAASMAMTAVWEAGLCRNDVTRPGSFYVARGHEAVALSSREFAMLRANLSVTQQAFGTTIEYKALLEDLCRVPPP